MMVVSLLIAAGNAQADFVFGEPVSLGPAVNGPEGAYMPSLSADELELYFCAERPGGKGDLDIWVCTRMAKDEGWGEPKNLGPVINTSAWEGSPSLSGDGLSLYFVSFPRTGNLGLGDIWVAKRATRSAAWGAPENLGAPVNTADEEAFVIVSSDELELYFSDWEPVQPGGYGGRDLWVSTRPTVSDPWGSPVRMNAPVNGPTHDEMHTLSSDGLVLLFSSWGRSGGYGARDIWMTRRNTTSSPWSTPVNLGPTINSPDFDQSGAFSPDGSTLYFNSRNRPGGYSGFDLWQAPVLPVVDFTGDYKVDIDDLLLLIEHWGQNAPAYDMGPMPWGDGVVDAADLDVLMSYWGQELPDPHFLGHWKLDETEDMLAADSIDDNQGIVIGNPVWQPGSGQIKGALKFDGIDDMIILKPVLNPEDGPFSVFAWIKGGAPGQVILSQQGGANWLQVDADGTLMTELTKSGGRTTGTPLYSDTVITDGNWHRVGFVWDGAQRILYVDDIPVAVDDQNSLGGATGGLVIGVGTDNQADTFWSGMIDDVRIYDRVVEP